MNKAVLHISLICLRVKSNRSKLEYLVNTVLEHFLRRDKVLILCPTLQAAEYVDELLWKSPPEAILPHEIAEKPCEERVAITLSTANINRANIVINLCPEPAFTDPHVEKIYEILDETTGEKIQSNQKKLDAYKQLGLSLL